MPPNVLHCAKKSLYPVLKVSKNSEEFSTSTSLEEEKFLLEKIIQRVKDWKIKFHGIKCSQVEKEKLIIKDLTLYCAEYL